MRYIRTVDRELFIDFNQEHRQAILAKCVEVTRSYIAIHNLTDFKKVWDLLPTSVAVNYFSSYINIFYDYKINTTDNNKIDAWIEKFVARLFLYLDEKQVFYNFNSLGYDTEEDRYTLTKWHSYDERHKDGIVDKTIIDNRNFDYPQYTSDVITPDQANNLEEAGIIVNNENSINGVLKGVNINDNKSVTNRDTTENQNINTKSGDSDYKESWSIPKEVIGFATQRFNQMSSLQKINYNDYYDWMLPLFITFYTQSDTYS